MISSRYDFIYPSDRKVTISDILPTIANQLSGGEVGYKAFDLEPAERYVLVLVDGLGRYLLEDHRCRAPFLSEALSSSIEAMSSIPSTTATAMASLGLGEDPGSHGIAGYSFRYGEQTLTPLSWPAFVDPHSFHTHPSYFARLSACGMTTATVSLAQFENSGLTKVALDGSDFYPISNEEDSDERLLSIRRALLDHRLVFTYERRLDHIAHLEGSSAPRWSDSLDSVDEWIERLRDELDESCRIVVTADHGMIDVDRDQIIMIEDHPQLSRGLSLIAGEGRLRHLYGTDPKSIAHNWRSFLGDRAEVWTRQEAINLGLFGKVDTAVEDRFGDVIVAMRDRWAVMTWTKPKEIHLVGQHGSLTAAESLIPLIIV